MSAQRIYDIPGERIRSLDEFWTVIGEAVNGPDGYFGRNLDAFSDCLRGGFGTPEAGFGIRWLNHRASARALGYEETVRQLENRLANCHPANRPYVRRELEAARRQEGPTVFDWLVEIITDNEIDLELA